MTHPPRAALLLSAALLASPLAAQPVPRSVLVRFEADDGHRPQREVGVGVMRPRGGGECFVVTPRHVVGVSEADAIRAGRRTSVGAVGRHDSLALEPQRYSTDVSILRVTRAVGRAECPPWGDVAEVNRVLRHAATRRGTLVPWTETGPGRAMEVEISRIVDTQFSVTPVRGSLRQGHSGSLVFLDGRPVGMVVRVDTAGSVALRLDYLERHIGPFFDPTPAPDDAVILLSLLVPGAGQMRTDRGDRGLLWMATTAGAVGAMYLYASEEREEHTQYLPDGTPQTYFEVRPTRPLRRYSWVPWLLAGVTSFAEARGHAVKYHIPREQTAAEPPPPPRVRLRADARPGPDGSVAVQLGEIRF